MYKLIWSGPVAAVLLIVGLFESNIATRSTDGAIEAWLTTHGNISWLAHSFASTLAAVALVVFAHALRARVGEGAPGRLVESMATLAAAMLAVGAALFAAIPVGRVFEGAPQPDPSTYRYVLSAAASVMVIFVSPIAAGMAASAGVGLLRSRTAPRWVAITSIVLAVLMLVSAFVAPLMVFGLWLVVTGVALGVRRPTVAAQLVVPVPV